VAAGRSGLLGNRWAVGGRWVAGWPLPPAFYGIYYEKINVDEYNIKLQPYESIDNQQIKTTIFIRDKEN